ncbi:bacterio-opsin activator domain-containing protein [Natrinema altunense]|uniref:PAS domain S-box protein n=1 Tax=Natrinema altunense TaxID=222984 RepID=A0A482XUN5_9EURY|nr:bacterio-opsin activator domain-containing protein [Natrinema altunense]RZH66959.1 PAS domain S-box protein [Natrinema altunense]
MSDGTATVVHDTLRVLVVGNSDSADDATTTLAAAFDDGALLRARTLEGALERLAARTVHCLVCPFASADAGSPATDALLEELAARTGERPIVALVDDGDAARALAAGASDVVEPTGSDAVLTARVRTAAERERYRLAATTTAARPRSILEHAAAVVWVLDADGEIEYASPAVEPRLGYTPTELERTTIARLVRPADREAVRETLAAVAAAPIGTTERLTCRLGHADGTWQVATLTCTNRLEDPAVEGIVVTRTGVPADETAVDDELRAGLDRLGDAFFTLGPRREVRYANEAALELFTAGDRPEGDAVPTGTVVWDLLPDRLGDRLADRLREADTTGESVEFETTLPDRERRLSVTVHPGDDGVSVSARERPAETAAPAASDRDRRALLEGVVDAIDDGIAVLEGTTVRLANAALLELAEADALVGRDLGDVFDDELAATVRERARSPVVRWMEPVTGELATDVGQPRPVAVSVAPLPDSDRTLCVVRDRRGSLAAALSTVQAAVATLRRADSPDPVRDAVTGAVRECTDADIAIWYLVDDRLRPATVATGRTGERDRDALELPAIDPGDTPLADALERGEPTVYEGGSLDAALARPGLRAERLLAVPIGDRGLVLATSTEPMAFDGLDTAPIETLADAAVLTLEGLERLAALDGCQRDREQLRTHTARAERVREATRSLLDAPTREAVERRLCEAVVALPSVESGGGIELAWVGHADDGGQRIVPETWAGRDAEFLEGVRISLDRHTGSPTADAASTREPVVLETLAAAETGRPDGDATERAWRRPLLERGIRSALSLPLDSGALRYGTLTAYATRPSAFGDATRRACEHLAAVAGDAIAAIETKHAFLADRVTELEVVLRDESEPLSSIAERLDRRIDVRAVIPRSSGGSTVFCSVRDSDAEGIHEAVGSLPAVDSVSIVGRGNGDPVVEIRLTEATEPSIARTVADHGGVLRSVTPVDDRTSVVIDLGEPIGVRSFLRALEAAHSGAELAARRERERPPRSTRPFETLAESLSERQRRTLEAAYHGGFFEWPREHTGEEVAESLGVSQPTFSRHLRIAQRKLFASVFDEAED